MRLENLGEVNSSCKEKLSELEVCKSEIGRLADVVEKRFSQVGDSECFFLDFYNFAPGQGGEGGGAATEEQSSSFGRKYAGGDKQMIRKSEIVIGVKSLNFRLRSR